MEPLWKLVFLMEPAPVTLILTAIAVTFGSAFRALNYGKEMEKNRDLSEASITLDRSQALMIPVMSSLSLLTMFYLFSSVSQLLTAFTAIASVSSLYFVFSPYIAHFKSQFALSDPFVSRCCSKSFTRIQALLLFPCNSTVAAWLVSGHWVLNNLLGISLCFAFVSHVRLPNIKVCAMLLICLFAYDIFWVLYSEWFFGANVMVDVATQQASNPVHTVATSLSLPGLQLSAYLRMTYWIGSCISGWNSYPFSTASTSVSNLHHLHHSNGTLRYLTITSNSNGTLSFKPSSSPPFKRDLKFLTAPLFSNGT